MPHWHLTKPLADGAAPLEKRLVWLRLLRQLLALDAAAVLRPAQQSSAFILSSYLGILNSRCSLLLHKRHSSRAKQSLL